MALSDLLSRPQPSAVGRAISVGCHPAVVLRVAWRRTGYRARSYQGKSLTSRFPASRRSSDYRCLPPTERLAICERHHCSSPSMDGVGTRQTLTRSRATVASTGISWSRHSDPRTTERGQHLGMGLAPHPVAVRSGHCSLRPHVLASTDRLGCATFTHAVVGVATRARGRRVTTRWASFEVYSPSSSPASALTWAPSLRRVCRTAVFSCIRLPLRMWARRSPVSCQSLALPIEAITSHPPFLAPFLDCGVHLTEWCRRTQTVRPGFTRLSQT